MARRLTPPFKYFGGKSKIMAKLLELIPPHTTDVEVFGGAGGLLIAKPPSPVEVFNDINSNITNFYKVLRNKKKLNELIRQLALSPYSREEYKTCLKSLNDNRIGEVERARCWFVAAAQSFSGLVGKGWSFDKTGTCQFDCIESNKVLADYLRDIEKCINVHLRIRRVQIEKSDFRKLIPRYDTEDSFYYIDPPYLPVTRPDSKKRGYQDEMTHEDHEELLDMLLKVKGKCLVSGYESELYERLTKAGWNKKKIKVGCGISTKKNHVKRTEVLWYNYEEPSKRKKLLGGGK